MRRDNGPWGLLAECGSSDDLAARMRDAILREPLALGDRLPTMRELAAISGLGRNDVYRALILLASEGWITQKRGAGTFVGPRKAETEGSAAQPSGNGRTTRRIGVIPPGWDPRASHETVGAILHGIGLQASRQGYRVEVIPAESGEYMNPAFADRVLSLDLDGVIWIQPSYDFPFALLRLVEARVPLVLTGRGFRGVDVPTVVMDYAALGDLVADFMEQYGRTRLVALVGCRDDTYTAGHVEGIRYALERRGLELPDDRLLTVRVGHMDRFYSMDLLKAAKGFFAQHPDFDAVYSMYPDMLEALFELHYSGQRRCPDDYVHIHFNRSSLPPHLAWQEMPIAFMEPQNDIVGRKALQELETSWGSGTDERLEAPQPVLFRDPRLDTLLARR